MQSLYFHRTPGIQKLRLQTLTLTPALKKPGLQLQTSTPGGNVCVLKDDLRETLSSYNKRYTIVYSGVQAQF